MMKTKVLKYGIFSLVFLFGVSAFAQQTPKKITLEDVFKNRKFSSKGFSGVVPMEDGEHYCQVKKDSLNVYEYKTANYVKTIVTSSQLVPAGDTTPLSISGYEFGPGETKLIFSKDDEPLYRWSSKANYYVYDIATGTLTAVSDKGKQRLVSLSPDGTKIAFVRDNNLFVKDLTSNIEHPTSNIEEQITTDGKVNEIINGATDWVYEEEFEFTQAFFWSPDSKKIAWYRFDESKVKEYHLTYYGDLYPELYKYKYPKAGEDNSLISIHIWDPASGSITLVDIGAGTDIYIPRIKWTEDPATLALYRMNRHQDKLELLLADAATGATRVIYTEENKCYIEINDDWTFLKDKKRFILSSEKDGFRHLYLYDMAGKLINQVTSGQWEVTEFLGVNEEKKLAYFIPTTGSPLERDLASVSLDGKKLTLINPAPGNDRITFTPGFKYYVNNHSDINTPPVITVRDPEGRVVREIEKNVKLTETMKEYGFGKAEFFTFTTADGTLLNGWMLKPGGFDVTKKYPVLFTVYGGPGSQTVQNSWGTVSSWNQLLAQNGIIVVSVDNRGTGGRGEEFKKCTYLELGKYETLDQIEAAKYLGTLPYVDTSRIGMWGWSFGGYLTLSCLTKGADYFSMGVAVAPVTNWKYYDNIYTERFMRTPKENEQGYEENSPVNHAAKMTGKLLLIHGMADDNVHPQNSYDFVTALVAANKQFDEQLYPNSNHGIYSGKNTTFHLYSRMTEFILKNLQVE
jgi:dipeptidyl-peptidase-4